MWSISILFVRVPEDKKTDKQKRKPLSISTMRVSLQDDSSKSAIKPLMQKYYKPSHYS